MAFAFIVAWVVLKSILDLDLGLVMLAAAAGWLTGTAVALGAEPGTLRRQRSTVILAVAVCVGIWLVGSYAAYVTSLAILPESTLDLAGRMANAPFLEVVGASFVPAGPLELAALALFGWLGAR
jgi:predicted secreted protein